VIVASCACRLAGPVDAATVAQMVAQMILLAAELDQVSKKLRKARGAAQSAP